MEGGRGGAAGETSGGAAGTIGEAGAWSQAGAGGDWNDECPIAALDPSRPPQIVPLTGNVGAHDPVVIEAHGIFYLFHTGRGIGVKTSADLQYWESAGRAFANTPAWLQEAVPGVADLWAPDISYFGGKYHLYYAGSTFGSNRSCIGHATRERLDTGAWADEGPVICSNVDDGSDDYWNAIDANVIVDREGTPWLSFGSFWGGLKMIQLDETGARVGTDLHDLARRTTSGGAIEAPFIVERCGYYYLFASFDYCCRGSSSTYRIMVGRSPNILGPYVDRFGADMMQGGGTLVLQADTRFRGPGHNAVLFRDDRAYNVYHAYDSVNAGMATLRISELAWDSNGWPVSAGP